MKKLVWLAMIAGVAVTAYGQGTISINTVGANAYLAFLDTAIGARAGGTGYYVGLYYASDAATLAAGGGTLANLGGPANNGLANLGTGGTAGFVTLASGGGNRTVGPGGTAAFFQLRAWSGPFQTWDAAKASGSGQYVISLLTGNGATPIIQATPAAAGNPVPLILWAPGSSSAAPLIADLVPVPEPSTLALAGLGLMGLILIRRRK